MIDADLLDNGTKHPNLAQMKMSAYLKKKGHNVNLLFLNKDIEDICNYDLLIVSKVFKFTNLPVMLEQIMRKEQKKLDTYNRSIIEILKEYSDIRPSSVVVLIGGTGFFDDGGRDLDMEIEHIMPDYRLYEKYIDHSVSQGRNRSYFDDYENYSIGFTTRGCFRKCSFCVNKKYDRTRKHSEVSEFFDKTRKKIYLWDDNLFAFHGWEEILDELIATGRPFQFRQGLDIRLMSEKKAKKLAKCRYSGDFIFAFDHIEDRERIEKKLRLWRMNCSKSTKFYVLCAYDPWQLSLSKSDQDKRDLIDIQNVFERIKLLMEYDCLPYIMRYEKYKESKYSNVYVQLARWCNMPQFFKKLSFREFCQKNQEYTKGNNFCKSMRTLYMLQTDAPIIAEMYFDIKYEQIEKKYLLIK